MSDMGREKCQQKVNTNMVKENTQRVNKTLHQNEISANLLLPMTKYLHNRV